MQKSLTIKEPSNEWLEFISRLGMIDLEQARSVFFSGDYNQLSDTGQKALYTAGRGKTLSLEGNLPGSKLSFDEALKLAENRNAEAGFPVKDEILAYVNYERGAFFTKYGEAYSALSLYRNARRLSESTSLGKTIDYQLYATDFESNRGGSLAESIGWINYFKENDMQIMHLIAQRRLASYFREQKKYNDALSWIEKGLKHAYTYEHGFMTDQFLNLKGFILVSMGKNDQAREIFLDLLPGVQGHYLQSAILENLTLTYYNDKNYEAAAETIGQAIAHSQKYEVLSRIPEECLFMGDLQRDVFQHPELATHYYEIGYLGAIRMGEFGFTLSGDRLKVIRAFEGRSKVAYSIPATLGKVTETFAFSMGRNWKEIVDLFHFSLLKTHLMLAEGSATLPAKLGLKPSTYYAIKRRLSNTGYNFESTDDALPISVKKEELDVFRLYVSKLTDLEWAEANGKFESEIIEYLFKHAGYQKTKLAEDLDISYPTVLQKTKSLTMSE